VTRRSVVHACAVAIGIAATMPASLVGQQQGALPPIYELNDDAYIRFPLPPGAEAYADINGRHLKPYVAELVEISHKSRDAGEQYWGRIAGTPYDAMAAQWLAKKFAMLGLQGIRFEELPLQSAWFPRLWRVTASAGGSALELTSAQPPMRTPGTPPGGLEAEAVYVGLGTPADFMGRDVRGKVAVIHSIPTPSALNYSARWNGAIKLAGERGAAAILIVLDIPGNRHSQMYGVGLSNIPVFSLGRQDGDDLRALIERGQPVKVRLTLDVDIKEGLKTASVWGMLPGVTDENIMVVAHLDAYFDGALDNGSGVATMLGLAEHFARLPREKRRRNIYFVSPAAHHEGDLAAKVWHETMQPFFAKTALILNSEHVSVTQSYMYGDMLWKSNVVAAHRFSIGRSRRLGDLAVRALTLFGVGMYDRPQPRPLGAVMPIWLDAPSIEVIESPNFYHTDAETLDIVPANGLEQIARAFAKLIDDVNTLDLTDLVDAASLAPRR